MHNYHEYWFPMAISGGEFNIGGRAPSSQRLIPNHIVKIHLLSSNVLCFRCIYGTSPPSLLMPLTNSSSKCHPRHWTTRFFRTTAAPTEPQRRLHLSQSELSNHLNTFLCVFPRPLISRGSLLDCHPQ